MALFVNLYNNGLLPLIRQLFLVPNRISEFIDLSNVPPPASIGSAGILSLRGNLFFYICISICLTSLALCTFNN
jgi:hypothetical protein